jgi:hypothetical protein
LPSVAVQDHGECQDILRSWELSSVYSPMIRQAPRVVVWLKERLYAENVLS